MCARMKTIKTVLSGLNDLMNITNDALVFSTSDRSKSNTVVCHKFSMEPEYEDIQ